MNDYLTQLLMPLIHGVTQAKERNDNDSVKDPPAFVRANVNTLNLPRATASSPLTKPDASARTSRTAHTDAPIHDHTRIIGLRGFCRLSVA